MAKGTARSCRELRFGSQYPHGAPQPSITLILKKYFTDLFFVFASWTLVFSLHVCLHEGVILLRVTESLSTGN